MRSPKTWMWVAVLGSFGTIAACSSGGGGGGGGGDPVPTSVAASKLLTDLSDQEATQYCEDLAKYFDTNLTASDRQGISCVLVGSFATIETDVAKARVDCKQAYGDCMQKGGIDAGFVTTTPSGDACSDARSRYSACPGVTVGDISGCESEILTYERNQLAQGAAFCDQIVAQDGGLGYGATPLPPSCASLQSKCPGIVKQ